jgi:hypothetical protein
MPSEAAMPDMIIATLRPSMVIIPLEPLAIFANIFSAASQAGFGFRRQLYFLSPFLSRFSPDISSPLSAR